MILIIVNLSSFVELNKGIIIIIIKISPDSERSIGDISETKRDTDLILAPF